MTWTACLAILVIANSRTGMVVGGAIGIAILTTLAASRTDQNLAGGREALDALRAGHQYALIGGGALLGLALVITRCLLDRPERHCPSRGTGTDRSRARAACLTRPMTARSLTRRVPSAQPH